MKYKYRATDSNGQNIDGVVNTKNRKELVQHLQTKNLVLISAEPIDESDSGFKFGFVSLKDKIFFVRHLKVMLAAGLPLTGSLDSISKKISNNKFANVIDDLKTEIQNGNKFSEALDNHSNIFSSFFVNMVQAGEESGDLERVLIDLGAQMERENKLKQKIIGSMIYPAMIVLAMGLMMILMMIIVVPQMSEVFKNIGVELPFSTRVIVFAGNFIFNNLLLLPFFFLASVALLFKFYKSSKGKKLFSFFGLRIPILSRLFKKKHSAQISRMLSFLLKSGLSLDHSLEIISQTISNLYVREELLAVAGKVRQGESFSELIRENEFYFSDIFIQMSELGEGTGEMSNTLKEAADFLEEEVERVADDLTSVLEPVLMIVIGILIGFFAFSMLRPMYSIIETM